MPSRRPLSRENFSNPPASSLDGNYTVMVYSSQDISAYFELAPIMNGDNIVQAFPVHTMKNRTIDGFGLRLAQLRKARGLTQEQLGKRLGTSQRVIAYYEKDRAQPPGSMLVDLADALAVTTDELLGRKPLRKTPPPRHARLLKRLERAADLPPADQRALFKVLDALLEKNQLTPPHVTRIHLDASAWNHLVTSRGLKIADELRPDPSWKQQVEIHMTQDVLNQLAPTQRKHPEKLQKILLESVWICSDRVLLHPIPIIQRQLAAFQSGGPLPEPFEQPGDAVTANWHGLTAGRKLSRELLHELGPGARANKAQFRNHLNGSTQKMRAVIREGRVQQPTSFVSWFREAGKDEDYFPGWARTAGVAILGRELSLEEGTAIWNLPYGRHLVTHYTALCIHLALHEKRKACLDDAEDMFIASHLATTDVFCTEDRKLRRLLKTYLPVLPTAKRVVNLEELQGLLLKG